MRQKDGVIISVGRLSKQVQQRGDIRCRPEVGIKISVANKGVGNAPWRVLDVQQEFDATEKKPEEKWRISGHGRGLKILFAAAYNQYKSSIWT